MTAVFADTFYYLALTNPGDQAHPRTLTLAQKMTGPVVTTTWVLTEVGDALSAPVARPVFLSLIRSLRSDHETEIIPSDPGLFERGLDLFERRPDKAWTMTDCISFVVMTDRGLTGDRHFEQAGFRALLGFP
jgi:predicted nucleic acid-binding protein